MTVERGWRGSPTYDVMAAAAASARLLGLDSERAANAIGFGAGFSFGNVECNIARSMETQFQLGLSARNGLLCTAIAKQQGRAAPTAIEGQAGFLNLFAGTTEFAGNVTARLGKEFEILKVTFKRYPTSMIAQSPTYIAARLARQEPHSTPRLSKRSSSSSILLKRSIRGRGGARTKSWPIAAPARPRVSRRLWSMVR